MPEMTPEVQALGPIRKDNGEINWDWVGSKGRTLREWYDMVKMPGERTVEQQRLDEQQFRDAVARGLIT